MPDFAAIVKDTLDNGGGSWSFYTGESLNFTNGYVVSDPGGSTIPKSEWNAEKAQTEFESRKAKASPTWNLQVFGTWIDDNGAIVCDTNNRIADRAEAIALGIKNSQDAIWDCAAGQSIYLPKTAQSSIDSGAFTYDIVKTIRSRGGEVVYVPAMSSNTFQYNKCLFTVTDNTVKWGPYDEPHNGNLEDAIGLVDARFKNAAVKTAGKCPKCKKGDLVSGIVGGRRIQFCSSCGYKKKFTKGAQVASYKNCPECGTVTETKENPNGGTPAIVCPKCGWWVFTKGAQADSRFFVQKNMTTGKWQVYDEKLTNTPSGSKSVATFNTEQEATDYASTHESEKSAQTSFSIGDRVMTMDEVPDWEMWKDGISTTPKMVDGGLGTIMKDLGGGNYEVHLDEPFGTPGSVSTTSDVMLNQYRLKKSAARRVATELGLGTVLDTHKEATFNFYVGSRPETVLTVELDGSDIVQRFLEADCLYLDEKVSQHLEECPSCKGLGLCPNCNGMGTDKNSDDGKCPDCKGSGRCSECEGTGTVASDE